MDVAIFSYFLCIFQHNSTEKIMSKKWAGRIIYWTLAVVPFLSLFVGQRIFGGYFFAIGLTLYVIFRIFLTAFRLRQLGIIERSKFWKSLGNPNLDIKYFKRLWWG
jgi:hypothetical protein